jgi:hypothetical protein
MDHGFDLKEFLDQQRREGVQQDEGAFTVARDKLLTKVAKFALPSDSDWILKVVQAVNVWRAPRLVVRQSRLATSFFFCPPESASFPTEGRLIQNLSAGVLNGEQPIAMLCMALRSLVDQVGLSFVLAIRHENVVGAPIFAGDDTTALPPKVRGQWASLSKNGVRLTVSHFRGAESGTGRYIPTFAGVPRRDIAIAKVLGSFAYASGVPIVFDGRLLTNPPQAGPTGHAPFTRALRMGFLGTETVPETAGLSGLPSGPSPSTEPALEDVEFSPFLPHSRLSVDAFIHRKKTPWYLMRTTEWRCLGDLLGTDLGFVRTDHSLFWVRNGVIVKHQTLKNTSFGSSIAIFLPADDLRSDLTGLSIDVDEQARNLADAALLATAESLTEFHHSLNTYLEQATSNQPDPRPTAVAFDEIDEAGFSIFTESLATPLMNAFRRMGQFRPPGVGDQKVRHFAKWWLMLPKELEQVIRDLNAGTQMSQVLR